MAINSVIRVAAILTAVCPMAFAAQDQAVPVVALDVATPEQVAHGGDLGRVLVDMRGQPAAGDRGMERGARLEQAVRAGEREARDRW